jgi:Heavy metal binding domain
MKKIIMLTGAIVIASLSLLAQDSKGKKMDTTMHKVYTCTMHPEVVSDKPGKCPKCGMDLVEKMNPKHAKMPMQKKDSMMTKKKMAS